MFLEGISQLSIIVWPTIQFCGNQIYTLLSFDVIYCFLKYGEYLIVFPCYVYHLKSLSSKCAKDCAERNYILFNSLFRIFGCCVSSVGIQKFSLTFSCFRCLDLSRFFWLSCSIIMNYAWRLYLWPSLSKWFRAGMLPFGITFFLWLLSLILKIGLLISQHSIFYILNIQVIILEVAAFVI